MVSMEMRSSKESKTTMTKLLKKMKEEKTNNEFQGNTDRLLTEIRKSMQDVKMESNKEKY